MKGIKEYIKKHGRHFTEELAYKVVGTKWKIDKIQDILSTMVWYNVNGTTSGDIIYIVNTMHKEYCPVFNIRGVCKMVAEFASDYNLGKEFAFNNWLLISSKENIDLTLYI